jgi:hypothetical protein
MTDNSTKTVTRFGKVLMMVGFLAWIHHAAEAAKAHVEHHGKAVPAHA